MKTILLADGEVGFSIAQWLIRAHPGDLSLVVTTTENEILSMAREAGIACITFKSSEMLVAHLKKASDRPSLGITAWWPKLLSPALVAWPLRGFVNTHPSLLPHNRGKHYNFWAIVEERPFGVTLHRIADRIDAGDIIAQQLISYGWEDDGGSLYGKAQTAMVQLFVREYARLRDNEIEPRKQDLGSGSYHAGWELEPASRIQLDSVYTAKELLNLLRARTFAGKPACWFEANGAEYEVRIQISKRCK